MAVDVKTLMVGSHVLVDGKRERVRGLDEDNGLIVRFPAEYVMANEAEAIPITSALLKELGFVRKPNADKKRYFDFLWEREDVESDDTCWEHCEKDNFFLLHSGAFGQLNVKYLHEAEAFLALHRVELIKE